MRAIPQTYSGVLFRSTLEADWAVNLDDLKMTWQYEPEGAILPSGEYYRCDVFLPRLTTFVEVKGPHDERIHKPAQLAEAMFHAPGCDTGRPVDINPFTDDDCACGFGTAFPWRLVVLARASERGRMVFSGAATPSHPSPNVVLAKCGVCQQYSFADTCFGWRCRRCRQSGDVAVFKSGGVTFRQIDHRAGASAGAGKRRRPARKSSTRASRAKAS